MPILAILLYFNNNPVAMEHIFTKLWENIRHLFIGMSHLLGSTSAYNLHGMIFVN